MVSARPRTTARLAATALLALLAMSGCQTGTGPLARWRMAHDASLAKGPTKEEVGDDRGMVARLFSPKKPSEMGPSAKSSSTSVMGSDGWSPLKPPSNPEADAEFTAAERLFQQ